MCVLVLLPEKALSAHSFTADHPAVSIRETVYLLREPYALDPDKVLAGNYDDKFEKYHSPYVPQDLRHPFWLKMQFTATAHSEPLLLITNARLFSALDIYIDDGSADSRWQHTGLGISRTRPDNVPPVPFFSIPFTAAPNATVNIYARVDTSMLEEMDWLVSSERFSPALYSRYSVGIGPMLGIMLALTVMYFSLAVTSGYANGSFWLALMTLFSALMVASLTQEIYQLGSKYTYEVILFVSYVGMAVLLELSRAILETHKYLPRLDRWVHYLSICYAFAFVASIVTGQKLALSLLTVVATLGQLVFISLCIFSYIAKIPFRHFYTLGMGSFYLGTLAATLGTTGTFNYEGYAKQCYVIGLILQILIFSFALNRHIRNVRIEREQLAREAAISSAESRSKSEFLAVMSHEIRTPMNGVLGMIELLQDTHLDETQRYYSDAIHSSGRTLLTVINDILDFSKIEAGKLELEAEPFALDKLVIEMIAPYRINFGNKDVEFLTDITPDTPNNLKGDPTRLQQTISNLLSNAFKFTEKGHIHLHIEPQNVSDSHVVLRISVSDTGIGITEESRSKLFTAFQQAGTDTTRKFGGTGLGLAICKRLIEAMNGEIGVTSVPGIGSTFYFTVELQRSASTETALPQSNMDIKGKHFLIIDDHLGYLELVRLQMSALGLSLDAVTSYDDALKAMETTLPSLIIIDKDLKDTDGLQVAKELRSSPQFLDIPLLMVTASSSIPSKAALREAGITIAAVKPVSTNQLRNLLQQALSTKNPMRVDHAPTITETASHRVLVAEDNAVNREVIRGLLRKLGITPKVVHGGVEAVDEACHGNYDIVFMDYEMPDLDGCQATQQIRQYENANGKHETPIYALTAHAMAEFELRTRQSGMNGHMTKPVNFNELEALLLRTPIRHRI